MIEQLINLGKYLEKNWDLQSFPGKATEQLLSFSNNLSLAEFEAEVMNWLEKSDLPLQLNLYNNFGEPSLTLFNNGKLAVDIYFWRKNDTLIHSHGFRGAFKVLYGLSLHEQFDVETISSYADDLKQTELLASETKIMSEGEVQIIDPELTHRVVHLGQPTVTLCLRTVEDTELSQWHHYPSGLSFVRSNLSEKIIKQMLYAQYLFESDSLIAKKYINDLLNELDASLLIPLYEGLCYNEFGIDESALDFFEEIFEQHLEQQPWIEYYKRHYANSAKNLDEFKASSIPVKLLAHCINSGYSKSKSARLLSEVTEISLDGIYKNLTDDHGLFSESFKVEQLDRINSFFNN